MSERRLTRRGFIGDVCAAGAAWMAGGLLRASEAKKGARLHLASNQYSWFVYFQREGRDFGGSLDEGLGELASSGMDGLEPLGSSPEQVDQLAPLLEKHRLEMRSLYVNSTLHEKEKLEESMESVLAIAERAKRIGTRIIVTNPSPIRWGGQEGKTDEQLEVQGRALERLGKELASRGLTLAYHNHDSEMLFSAREFHHMMAGTDPRYVTLCLDAHWIYRGSGNSQVALFDIVKLYGSRISELHLRQSKSGVWSETFCEGDIDYARLSREVQKMGVKPHLVMEQAVEQGTPKTMGTLEAHRRAGEHARRVFAWLGA
ncbi:MAG: TIM barrel protein [Planctomycetes bacterium]|nr:TIM barrel protein [Planctomycetota bacterium]